VGYALVTSFWPDTLMIGNGAYLAETLGLRCAAVNLETACGSFIGGLTLACGLVASGQVDDVLVVLSSAYSRAFEDHNPMAWTSGDGAAAFVIGRERDGFGLLGARSVNTAETLPSFEWEVKPHPHYKQVLTSWNTKAAGQLLDATAERCLPLCTSGALERAGLRLAEVDYFAVCAPTAWYVAYACQKLGLDAERVIDSFPTYANTGPVLTPTSLYLGARSGKLREGGAALAFSQGSASSAGAVVLRWGDVVIAEETN